MSINKKPAAGPGLVAALALGFLLSGGGLAAQDQAASGASSDDEMFGTEQVTEASPTAEAPQKAFLKYDQVKLGGSITSSLGISGIWLDPWGGFAFQPDDHYLSPALSSKLSIVAKPAEDFGVNLDFRMSYPFTKNTTVVSDETDNPFTLDVDEGLTTLSIPNISVWAAYAKFSLKDALFMSFGKQPIAWGVSKGFFQPADDIFAMSAVDYADTGAEREGPLAFKAMLPVPLTMTNFYFYAGLPSTDYTDLAELRLAAKAEINAGNTELALAGFYAYNDHPRAILMATTGNGDFNFFGEGVLKYGSERYFINSGGMTAAQAADRFWFSGTLGGYYTNSNANLTVMAQVLYNGEGQTEVSAQEAYAYYFAHSSEVDRMKFGSWYAGLSLSKTKLFTDDLSVGLYAIADLSDLSGFLVPSVSYAFSDYMNVKLSATFNFGGAGDEYILMGPDFRHSSSTPGAALSLGFTLGSGSF